MRIILTLSAHRLNSLTGFQGKASFLIQKLFGKLILSERRVVESYHDEVPPASHSQVMLSLVQSHEANLGAKAKAEEKKEKESDNLEMA